ncbi:MAG: VOC family protein [Fimbriimonadaceae bacterium]|nr:VOC family protein [Fimbriimonadaceae bacterium]
MSGPGLQGRPLAQVAIVVRDLEAAKARWAALLGVEVPETVRTPRGGEVNMVVRGMPSDATCQLAFFDLGNIQLELIEPDGRPSAWQEPLDERGEGLHHVAFWVDDMEQTTSYLADQGCPVGQRGDMGEGQYVYVDAQAQFGTWIELLQRKRPAG